jgi:predicted ABC-type ATPase
MKSKRLLVFAGPNGSGKTTIWQKFSQRYQGWSDALYINADDIKKEAGVDDLTAAQIATSKREAALESGTSFIMETVLSTERNIDLMQRAKGNGYTIDLLFVLTQDPEINIQRVVDRVAKGGHDVPVEKIPLRYLRSLRLLPRALEFADNVMVYNNSFDNPLLIIEKQDNGAIMLHPQSPPSRWGEQALRNLIGEQHSKNAVIKQKKL